MKKLFFLITIVFFIIILSLSYPPSGIGDTLRVTINAAQKVGPVPALFSPSVWISNPQRSKNRYILSKFLSENRPAVVQVTLRTLRHSKDFADFKRRLTDYLKLESVRILLQKMREYDSILVVGFETASMPGWLSSRSGNRAKPFSHEGWTVEQSSPPNDYNKWGKVVEFTLRSFVEKSNLKNLGFFVGHEPGAFWFGNEETFFKYYEYAARAAKRLHKHILVGGIGTQSVMQKKKTCAQYSPAVKSICQREKPWADPNNSPMLKNFIFYVAKHNVPLDFINWHSFNVLPSDLQKQAHTIKQWINRSGLDPNDIILYPSDWTYWTWYAGGYPADYLDTEETAAYAIHALYHMWKGGIKWHGHDFDIDNYSFEEQRVKQRKNAAFIGDWRIVTRSGLIKPIYNAFRLLDMISSTKQHPSRMLEATFPLDSTTVAIPVLKGNKVYVLLSNFIPIETSTLVRYMFEKTKEKFSFIEDEVYRLRECIEKKSNDKKGQKQHLKNCRDELRAEIKDPKKREALDFAIEIYTCLKRRHSFSNCLERASKKLKNPHNRKLANELKGLEMKSARPVIAKIHLENLPFDGNAELITYTIDDSHSNACRYNKKTEPSPTESSCGIGGDVDQALKNIRNNARKKAEETLRTYLRSKGYSQEYITTLINKIRDCDTHITTCLQRLRKDESFKSLKMQQDFTKLAKRCLDTYHNALYYDAHKSINALNSHDQIAVDGSKQTRSVTVKNGTYTFELKMQKNSVWLLIISQRS